MTFIRSPSTVFETFKSRVLSAISPVSDADLSPFTTDIIDILSDVVGIAAPAAGPFLAGMKQALQKIDEVKDRRVKKAVQSYLKFIF